MKKQMMDAIADTGLTDTDISLMMSLAEQGNAEQMKTILHERRKTLLSEIYDRDEQIRHIDWIIYHLSKQ